MNGKPTLITGATGFAGHHLVAACQLAGEQVVACGQATNPPPALKSAGVEYVQVDLLDASAIAALVERTQPTTVYHLAALASAGRSWLEPATTITQNTAMSFNLLEAIRQYAPAATVLIVGSSEVYGPPAVLPVTENAPLRPQNPYAVAKAGVDLLAGFYADAHALRIIRARPFNHAGPGQTTTYVIPALAEQIAAGLARGADPIPLVTGNPEARRDFTDVRDVVRAYRLLAQERQAGVFNICTGVAYSVHNLLASFAAMTGIAIDHQVDQKRLRPVDVPEIRGSHERLTAATGWEPSIPLEQTLADALAEFNIVNKTVAKTKPSQRQAKCLQPPSHKV